jgi:Glycosyltransferases, probably involved in cell wall biogenesis
MKRILLLLGLVLSSLYGSEGVDSRLINSEREVDGQKHIVIVVCSYNNSKYYQWNLDSIFAQKYNNYHVIYVDDCSPDDTFNLVQEHVAQRDMQEKCILVGNQTRVKALANLYNAINSCKSTDIIAILDGDDRFAHDQVLQKINDTYKNPNIWLTYGQFREWPQGRHGFCTPYPQTVTECGGFRYHMDTPSHLRTFYAGLFHKIRKEDLMFQGDFFPMTYDLAIMFPMIEMAGANHIFIPDILVDYNTVNDINDHKVSKGEQRKYDLIIRARTCYSKVDNPF